MRKINDSIDKLRNYIESEHFKGYDPYDTLNSTFPIQKLGHWASFIAIQFQKRNPINIRPLLGVDKFRSTKGMGVLFEAYLNLYEYSKDESYIPIIEEIKQWLIDSSTTYSEDVCWGYDYPYVTMKDAVSKAFPTVIHHAYIQRGFYHYYKLFGDHSIKEFLKKTEGFILNSLNIMRFDTGICFSYNPTANNCCYNASMHAAACLARLYELFGDKKLIPLIEESLDFVVFRQQPNGVWFYSFQEIDGPERKQIDFHQGFILESFKEVIDCIGYSKPQWDSAIELGLDYYYKKQFFHSGRSLWRIPREYPVDIHNQSQGIITFSKFAHIDPKYKDFVNVIADWTIENMQSKKEGFFYYRMFKYYTNKISYMRWSQAWMLLALSNVKLLSHKH